MLGETVAAAIVVREGCQVEERDSLRLAAQRLARCKLPQRVLFVTDIPRGATENYGALAWPSVWRRRNFCAHGRMSDALSERHG